MDTPADTDQDLLGPPLFDRALIERSRAENRPLFGHVAGLYCDILAKSLQDRRQSQRSPANTAKPKGLMSRLSGLGFFGGQAGNDRERTFRDDLIRWIEGQSDVAPAIPPGYIASDERFGDDAYMIALCSALHPDACWDARGANRLGKFLRLSRSRARVGGPGQSSDDMTLITDYDAALEYLAVLQGCKTQFKATIDAAGTVIRRFESLGLTLPRLGAILGVDAMGAFRTLAKFSGFENPTVTPIDRYKIAPRPILVTGIGGFMADHAGQITEEVCAQPDTAIGLVLETARYFDAEPVFGKATFRIAAEASVSRRKAAEPFVAVYPADRLQAACEDAFATLTPAARARLLEMLVVKRPDEARTLFPRWLETEAAAKPKAVMETALDRWAQGAGGAGVGAAAQPDAPPDDETGYLALDGTRVTLPPLPEEEPLPPLEEAAFDPLRPLVSEYNQRVRAHNEKELRWAGSQTHRKPSFKPEIDAIALANSQRQAMNQTLLPKPKDSHGRSADTALYLLKKSFTDLYATFSGLDPEPMRRMFDQEAVDWRHLINLSNNNKNLFGRLDVLYGATADDRHLELGALWRRIEAGLDIRRVVRFKPDLLPVPGDASYRLQHYYESLDISPYAAETLWPGFLTRLPKLLENLRATERKDSARGDDKARLVTDSLTILAQFPKAPMCVVPDLLRLALGPERSWRRPAQDLLADHPAATALCVETLGDRNSALRIDAARWLARRGDASALPAVEKALAKEKLPNARAALMGAVKALGGDLRRWLDPAALQSEAEKGLKTLKLDAVDWLMPRLPRDLCWADGTPLSPQILDYWIALAVKLKEPGGNALFQLWLDELRPQDAARLGLTLFRAWLARDVLPRGEAEARAEMATMTPQQITSESYRYMSWEACRQASFEEKAAAILKGLAERERSAIDAKGVLGLCARAPGGEIAALARPYLKKHGERVNQAKAVLEAVAAIPDVAAIQVIVGAADHTRQKTVQQLAQELMEGIAAARGWTPEDLADRTVSACGFENDGTQAVDCGAGRIFVLRLDDSAAVQVLNPDGKVVKALPAPAGDDEDQAKGKAARKTLTAVKKQLAQTVEHLTARWITAMCVERAWPLEDWTACFATHPVAGRLAQRLVWQGLDADGTPVSCFRPLADGSWSDAEDGTVDPSAVAAVRLVHAGLLTGEDVAAWRAHLTDYEVAPLFDQFLAPVDLTEAEGKRTELHDRRGWIIETFTLRAQATKRGYERGLIGDGGGFTTYVKRFRAAGLEAELRFSGSCVPEENEPCALLGLAVCKPRQGWHGRPVALGSVPPALLAALRADFIAIGDAGSGYAEDFENYGP
ncbi:DUF4132 domain-containing protein [Rhodospira trueperi]|uniref:DUF4132 domain-containing protein n=1 Tax=Rhodospira trueperi TaxID=69960 RepID=A0A1G7FQQ8_9PROT|nr:DUF4132 domain-containing protein [Rhodospira trueperi]SDE78005.1 protein of unknown function [Rhodospira trueperi]